MELKLIGWRWLPAVSQVRPALLRDTPLGVLAPAAGHHLCWFVLKFWSPSGPRGGRGSGRCFSDLRAVGARRGQCHAGARRDPPGHGSGALVVHGRGVFLLLKVLLYINFKLQCLHYKMTPLAFWLRILYMKKFSLSEFPEPSRLVGCLTRSCVSECRGGAGAGRGAPRRSLCCGSN